MKENATHFALRVGNQFATQIGYKRETRHMKENATHFVPRVGNQFATQIGYIKCRRGGTGRRTGLKILRDLYSRTGSIPVCGIGHRKGNS